MHVLKKPVNISGYERNIHNNLPPGSPARWLELALNSAQSKQGTAETKYPETVCMKMSHFQLLPWKLAERGHGQRPYVGATLQELILLQESKFF